mgnify:CR=1 FL=1
MPRRGGGPLILQTAPDLEAGARLAFAAALRVASVGPEAHEAAVNFDVSLETLELPKTAGLYKLKATCGGLPDDPEYKSLDGLTFEMWISPWFGLVNAPLPEGHAAAAVSLPIVQAV